MENAKPLSWLPRPKNLVGVPPRHVSRAPPLSVPCRPATDILTSSAKRMAQSVLRLGPRSLLMAACDRSRVVFASAPSPSSRCLTARLPAAQSARCCRPSPRVKKPSFSLSSSSFVSEFPCFVYAQRRGLAVQRYTLLLCCGAKRHFPCRSTMQVYILANHSSP